MRLGSSLAINGFRRVPIPIDAITVSISGDSETTDTDSRTLDVTFSEDVEGLSSGDFDVTNGIASNLQGTGSEYTLDVVASDEGEVTVVLPQDSVGNLESNTFTFVYDIAPTISDDTLQRSNITTDGFTVTFEKATDGITPQSELVYRFYTAVDSPGSLDTVTNIEANGTLEDEQTDTDTFTVTGFSEGDEVDFNIIVVDERDNKTAYNDNFVNIPDETAPTVSDGTLTVSNRLTTSFNINFTEAEDNIDEQEQLQYSLFTSSSDNLSDVNTIESNGTLQETGTGVTQLSASGLSENTTYFVNVMVEDEAGNKSIYTSRSVTTDEAPEDTEDPTVSDATLSTSSVGATGFLVDFDEATDNETAQGDLVYRLYISDTNNLDTDSDTVEANGTLESTGTGVSTLSVSDRDDGEEVWFNIVVEDEAGNKAIYTQNSETTLDETAPDISDRDLTTSNVSSSSFTISFTEATDNLDDQGDLQYSLYTSSENNLTTDAGTVESNGTLQESDTGVSQFTLNELSSDTLYYFNVVVEDAAGNKSIYSMGSQQTDSLTTAEYSGDFELQLLTLD